MSALNADQMRAYAAQMYGEGERLHQAHRSDGNGACARCSGVWPCPDRRRGEMLLQHYQPWVQVTAAAPASTPRTVLDRLLGRGQSPVRSPGFSQPRTQ